MPLDHLHNRPTEEKEEDIENSQILKRDEILLTACQELETSVGVGQALHEKLANYIQCRFTRPLADDKARDKSSLYKRPENCPSLQTKKTNNEVWKMFSSGTKKIDIKYMGLQNDVAKATIAIALCVQELKMISKLSKEDNEKIKNSMKLLFDTISILGNGH